MAKYSPVGPISWLEQLQDVDMLGDYLLLLAHEVLEEPQRYRVLMKGVRDNNHNPFIILDNSLIELGAALPPEHMHEACRLIQPSCVVLPDIMQDPAGTVAASILAARRYREKGIATPFLCVIHGRNVPQLQWCAQQLAMDINPRYWGLPRVVANTIGTRMVFGDVLPISYPQVAPNTHLLGMSHNIKDDLACCRYSGIMGIDSANPLILGQTGNLLETIDYKHVSREGIWGTEPIRDITLENIRRMREAAQYESTRYDMRG